MLTRTPAAMILPRCLIAVILLCCGHQVEAQESANSCGGNATGTGGSISFTIGQVAFSTTSNTSGLVSQGVQKGFELLIPINIPAQEKLVSIYPNPAIQNIALYINNSTSSAYLFQLYNFQGKLLKSGRVVSNPTVIALNSLSSGTYFIHVFDQKSFHQTLKVVKL